MLTAILCTNKLWWDGRLGTQLEGHPKQSFWKYQGFGLCINFSSFPHQSIFCWIWPSTCILLYTKHKCRHYQKLQCASIWWVNFFALKYLQSYTEVKHRNHKHCPLPDRRPLPAGWRGRQDADGLYSWELLQIEPQLLIGIGWLAKLSIAAHWLIK